MLKPQTQYIAFVLASASDHQWRMQDFWKGGPYIYKGVGVRFADLAHFS